MTTLISKLTYPLRLIGGLFLTGLITLLPIFVTLYVLYWVGVSLEALLGRLLEFFLPERFYHPGMGLLAGVLLILVVGVFMSAWIGRRLFTLSESLFFRIPLVKTLYGATRDFTNLFAKSGRTRFSKVVIVRLGNPPLRVLGFITSETTDCLPGALLPEGEESVIVYLPLSYQIGGHTVVVPRSSIEPTDLTFEEAMRFIITAGVSKLPATPDDPETEE